MKTIAYDAALLESEFKWFVSSRSLGEMGTVDPTTLPVALGDVIGGKYAVTGVLGSGGMGVVLSGRHLELGERVAIKFLHREFGGHAERFFREARAAARIKGEHVVRIFDVGRLPSSEPYIVMELLDGTDVAARLERGPMSLQELADVLLSVCRALAEAHGAGIIHRDLKPANIFLARGPDGDDVVKLLDFGVAKVPEGGAITGTTNVLGSPLYMSPEQLMASRDVDARSDIWSLGIVLYEALTGTLPFRGNSLVHQAMLVREKPTPVARSIRPDLPPEIDVVVARCLAKEASDRFADVAEFAEAIAPFASPSASQSALKIRRVLENARRKSDPALESTVSASSSDPATGSGRGVRPGSGSGSGAGPDSHAATVPAPVSVRTLDALSTAAEVPPAASATPIGRWAFRAGLAVVVLAMTAIVITQLLDRSGTKSQTSSAQSAQPSAHAVPEVLEPAMTTTPAPSSAPTTVLQPMPTACAAPVVTATPKKPPPVATTTKSATPSKPAVNCNPPYTIDEKGVRRAKLECL